MIRKIVREWVPAMLIAVLITILFRSYVAEAMVVPSGSMLPTVQIQDRLVVEKISRPASLKVGDIVVFHPPDASIQHLRYVKRLIGVAGDVIQIKDGFLFRNGEKVIEDYIMEPMRYEFGPVTVPENKYFFLGDNRNDSLDSHLWKRTFADKESIIGKVIFNIPTHVFYSR